MGEDTSSSKNPNLDISTSRRHCTFSYDMLDKYNLMHHTKTLGLLQRIHNEGNTVIEEIEVKQCDVLVTYCTMNKFKKIEFRLIFRGDHPELYITDPCNRVRLHEPIHSIAGFMQLVSKYNFVERVN